MKAVPRHYLNIGLIRKQGHLKRPYPEITPWKEQLVYNARKEGAFAALYKNRVSTEDQYWRLYLHPQRGKNPRKSL